MDSVCVDLREKGLSGEEKGRKSEVEMDGQCACGLEREGTVGGGDAETGCAEATRQKQRPNMDVGKDAVEEEVLLPNVFELGFPEVFCSPQVVCKLHYGARPYIMPVWAITGIVSCM